MKQKSFLPKTIILFALIITAGMSSVVMAQDRRVFSGENEADAKKARPEATAAAQTRQLTCRGPIRQVTDIADENTRFTPANFFTMPGGGEGGGFDKTPLLTTRVSLRAGCLNAHLDAIVGGQLYGIAGLTMFQVTLTRQRRASSYGWPLRTSVWVKQSGCCNGSGTRCRHVCRKLFSEGRQRPARNTARSLQS